MPISAQEAAQIAKERGLSLSDARAILGMAETEEQAKELADQFATNESDFYGRLADRTLGFDK